ncbi:MAG: membrane protein insertion efficiency factor YidD [Clostridia bacterium]|nr:membrane protein insertion efficiency factor YidD [Clostridia bacterium]
MNKISKAIGECLIFPIKFYRKYISPMKKPCCKYYPTCSEYAIRAIRKYGPVKGSVKGAWRILRCNPFSRGGVDEP